MSATTECPVCESASSCFRYMFCWTANIPGILIIMLDKYLSRIPLWKKNQCSLISVEQCKTSHGWCPDCLFIVDLQVLLSAVADWSSSGPIITSLTIWCTLSLDLRLLRLNPTSISKIYWTSECEISLLFSWFTLWFSVLLADGACVSFLKCNNFAIG